MEQLPLVTVFSDDVGVATFHVITVAMVTILSPSDGSEDLRR